MLLTNIDTQSKISIVSFDWRRKPGESHDNSH
jgi:hypothetical protein